MSFCLCKRSNLPFHRDKNSYANSAQNALINMHLVCRIDTRASNKVPRKVINENGSRLSHPSSLSKTYLSDLASFTQVCYVVFIDYTRGKWFRNLSRFTTSEKTVRQLDVTWNSLFYEGWMSFLTGSVFVEYHLRSANFDPWSFLKLQTFILEKWFKITRYSKFTNGPKNGQDLKVFKRFIYKSFRNHVRRKEDILRRKSVTSFAIQNV